MPVIRVIPIGNTDTCSFNADGTISVPQRVMQRLNWQHNQKIALSYIAEPLTLLLAAAENEVPGFTLSYRNRTVSTSVGGRISCTKFTNEVMRTKVALPARRIFPVFLRNVNYQLALLLQPIDWLVVDFSLAGCLQINPELKGVYQLLSADQKVLRIGEGAIQSRIKEHLKDERLARAAKTLRYLGLADKEETSLMEKILIAHHEANYRELPQFNAIRA